MLRMIVAVFVYCLNEADQCRSVKTWTIEGIMVLISSSRGDDEHHPASDQQPHGIPMDGHMVKAYCFGNAGQWVLPRLTPHGTCNVWYLQPIFLGNATSTG